MLVAETTISKATVAQTKLKPLEINNSSPRGDRPNSIFINQFNLRPRGTGGVACTSAAVYFFFCFPLSNADLVPPSPHWRSIHAEAQASDKMRIVPDGFAKVWSF
jgi:hypothetical protein